MSETTNRPEITTRNLDFALSPDLPRYWHGGDPFITHFFNGLSVMFPEGERFFMDAVRRYVPRISDPKLREDVRGFLGQEGIHAREHERYNRMLAEQGYPIAKMERLLELGIRMDRKWPPKWQLAMTCALEHFTAVFADVVLRDPRILADAHPTMARLWRWHAIEETEHKAVAFDVYRAVAPGLGGYLRRVIMMAIVSVLFGLQILIHQLWLVWHDGLLWKIRARRRAFRFFWKDPGFLKQGLRLYLVYYRRDFHPWRHDNSELVERWKADYSNAA
ncbi:MAG: metal-dependent hydrolase [Candidatus Binatia bacterium]